MREAILKSAAVAVAFATVAVSSGSGAQPTPTKVCALGPTTSFNPMRATPPSPRAVALSQDVYRALCPTGCGTVTLVSNVSAPNALILAQPGLTSVVHYSPDFMNTLETGFGTGAAFGVLAHELGHHIDLNTPKPAWFDSAWGRELRADAFAGCALARAGLEPDVLARAMAAMMRFPSPSHPGADLRIPAVRRGWHECGGAGVLDLADPEYDNDSTCRTERTICVHQMHPEGHASPCTHPIHPAGDQHPCRHPCRSPWGFAPCHAFDLSPCAHPAHPPHVEQCSHTLHPGGDTTRVCN